jgi:hypothetical protein
MCAAQPPAQPPRLYYTIHVPETDAPAHQSATPILFIYRINREKYRETTFPLKQPHTTHQHRSQPHGALEGAHRGLHSHQGAGAMNVSVTFISVVVTGIV